MHLSTKAQIILGTYIVTKVVIISASIMPYLTFEEHKRNWKLLESEIMRTYPSDGDDNSEIVTQEVDELHGVTFYKLQSNPDKVVFAVAGKKHVGKSIVVLFRGEDYMDPLNKDRFVVLRQREGGSDYNVHVAVIWRTSEGVRYVVFENVVVAMVPELGKVLTFLEKPYILVEPHSSNSVRPHCGWFGFVLMCESDQEIMGQVKGDGPPIVPMVVGPPVVLPSLENDTVPGEGSPPEPPPGSPDWAQGGSGGGTGGNKPVTLRPKPPRSSTHKVRPTGRPPKPSKVPYTTGKPGGFGSGAGPQPEGGQKPGGGQKPTKPIKPPGPGIHEGTAGEGNPFDEGQSDGSIHGGNKPGPPKPTGKPGPTEGDGSKAPGERSSSSSSEEKSYVAVKGPKQKGKIVPYLKKG